MVLLTESVEFKVMPEEGFTGVEDLGLQEQGLFRETIVGALHLLDALARRKPSSGVWPSEVIGHIDGKPLRVSKARFLPGQQRTP